VFLKDLLGNIILIIPEENIIELSKRIDKKYVFVVDAAGILHSREIQIAAEKRGIYILKGGLSTTDRFLVDGIQKVKDDQKVKVRFKNAREVLKSFQLTAD
jgi:membrane fusion protein (multidrug efflux system)